jgi:hypothetical protein
MSINSNNRMSEQEQREQQERMEKCRTMVNITGDVVYDYDLVSCAGAAFTLSSRRIESLSRAQELAHSSVLCVLLTGKGWRIAPVRWLL